MWRGTLLHELWNLPLYWQQVSAVQLENYQQERIQFGNHNRQYCLVLRPKQPVKAWVVYWHGGGWQFGTPEKFSVTARPWLQAGYGVVLPSYRRIPFHQFESIREDTVAALAACHNYWQGEEESAGLSNLENHIFTPLQIKELVLIMMVSELLIDVDGNHFSRCFEQLEDIRSTKQVRYPMQEVLFLAICSVLSGYEANSAIEEFGKLKLEWLRQYYPYTNGIPTHETIGNVIGIIDKRAFEKAFTEWVSRVFGSGDLRVLHIDGKRLKGSANKELQDVKPSEGGQNASLIVNTYASGSSIVVAQADVSQSGDEKQGARQLLEQLHVKDRIITGDGNYCTKDLLKRIRLKGGQYLLTLKGNNPTLLNLAEKYYDDVRVDKMPHYTEEQGHGRHERRTYHAMTVKNMDHPKLKEYAGLNKIIRVRRQRKVIRKKQAQPSDEVHYYITSSDESVLELAKIIRSHWQIENNLHWVLDVVFEEDASRKRTGNQAANFSLIRKIVFNMIKKANRNKSMKAVRMSCAISDQERHNILGFS